MPVERATAKSAGERANPRPATETFPTPPPVARQLPAGAAPERARWNGSIVPPPGPGGGALGDWPKGLRFGHSTFMPGQPGAAGVAAGLLAGGSGGGGRVPPSSSPGVGNPRPGTPGAVAAETGVA
jgi:hypothetical protein